MKMQVVLPEGTIYAGFWMRVLAVFIDCFILFIITAPVSYLLYGAEHFSATAIFLGAGDFFINFAFPLVATLLFWVYKAGTPGKLLLHMHIVNSADLSPLTFVQSVVRYLGYFVSIFFFCLGFFWIGWDKRKQGWHDKIARTVVIRKRQ